jgi:hypothetical protein
MDPVSASYIRNAAGLVVDPALDKPHDWVKPDAEAATLMTPGGLMDGWRIRQGKRKSCAHAGPAIDANVAFH